MAYNRTENFFQEDTVHGHVKRILYKKYIQAYIKKTQSAKHSLRTIIIDGFAGVGRYGNEWPSEIDKYGSPLISLMVALDDQHDREINGEKKKESAEQNVKKADKGGETTASAQSTTNEAVSGGPPINCAIDVDIKQKKSLWGWPSSELEPEAEISSNLESENRRDSLEQIQPVRIELIFIESDSERFKMLCANVELLVIKFLQKWYPSYRYGFSLSDKGVLLLLDTRPFSISVKVINKKFTEIKPPSDLGDPVVRSLTFIDPFGYTQTPMCHLIKFVPGTGNEVFINFMSSFVNRFVSSNPQGIVKLYGIDTHEIELEDDDAYADFVKQIIYTSHQNKEQDNNINKCTANYESFLKTKTNSKYSLVFEVKDRRNSTIYHMVHITNHIKGVEAMKEAMNRCSQRMGEMTMSAYDIVRKGIKLNLGNLDDHVKAADEIFKKYRGAKGVELQSIKNYILFDTNFVFRKKPLKLLKTQGQITAVFDEHDKPPKVKNSFPDVDSKTKKPIKCFISFSDEIASNEGNSNAEKLPGADGDNADSGNPDEGHRKPETVMKETNQNNGERPVGEEKESKTRQSLLTSTFVALNIDRKEPMPE